MKYLFPLAAVALIPAFFPASAAMADPWDDYSKLMSHYYMIDQVAGGDLTCSISSSAIDDVLQKVPDVSSQVVDKIKKFTVTVHAGGSVTFNTPTIRVYTDLPDRSTQIDKAFAQIIDGLQQMTLGTLDGMVTPQKDKIKNLAVVSKGDDTMASFDRTEENGTVETVQTIYSGDHDDTKESHKDYYIEAHTHYIPLDGKLSLSDSTANGHGAASPVLSGSLKVKYQQVGKVYFPSVLSTDFKVGQPGAPEQHLEVDFTGCSKK